MRKSSFRGKVSKNAQKQKQSSNAYGYLILPKGIRVFSPDPNGKYLLDFIPYIVTDKNHPDRDDESGIALPGQQWYRRPIKVHRNIGVNNEAVVCPTSVGKRCPICEYRAEQIKKGASKEITNPLKTTYRNLYLVIPKGDRKYEEDIHIWDVSQFLFQDLLNEELEENEDYEVFPDLEQGYSVRVRFESTTIGASKPFATARRIDFIKREEQYDPGFIDECPNLDKMFKVYSYDELQRKFFEMDVGGEPSIDDDIIDDDIIDDKADATIDNGKGEKEERGKGDLDAQTSRRRHARSKKQVEDKNNKCPYGHRFGLDCEKYNDCDNCDLWDDCIDEQERLQNKE